MAASMTIKDGTGTVTITFTLTAGNVTGATVTNTMNRAATFSGTSNLGVTQNLTLNVGADPTGYTFVTALSAASASFNLRA